MFELKLKNKTIHFRKWKNKDRIKFVQSLNKFEEMDFESKEEAQAVESDILNALVYDAIEEKDIILSFDEFKYVLSRIRIESFGDDFEQEVFCTECETTSSNDYKLSECIRFSFLPINEIVFSDGIIKLQEPKNKEIYLEFCQEDPINELLLRIKSINDNESMTYDDIVEYFNELDVDILDEILKEWDRIRSKVDNINKFECQNPECRHIEFYEFDEITNFLPKSWDI